MVKTAGSIDPTILETNALLLRYREIEELEFELYHIHEQAHRAAIQSFISDLHAMNTAVCSYWREQITQHNLRGSQLRVDLNRYTGYATGVDEYPHYDYEDLDILIQGIFEVSDAPGIYVPANPELVHMERSPASAILDMVDHISWNADDVFIDLGSGFGYVPMLVHLLTDVDCMGIELDAGYYDYAQRCAQSLGPNGVAFVNADVRAADLSMGTVFYLFTPFSGAVLRDVLQQLEAITAHHPITVATFGPCTPWIAQVPWLTRSNNPDEHTFKLTLFYSTGTEQVHPNLKQAFTEI